MSHDCGSREKKQFVQVGKKQHERTADAEIALSSWPGDRVAVGGCCLPPLGQSLALGVKAGVGFRISHVSSVAMIFTPLAVDDRRLPVLVTRGGGPVVANDYRALSGTFVPETWNRKTLTAARHF